MHFSVQLSNDRLSNRCGGDLRGLARFYLFSFERPRTSQILIQLLVNARRAGKEGNNCCLITEDVWSFASYFHLASRLRSIHPLFFDANNCSRLQQKQEERRTWLFWHVSGAKNAANFQTLVKKIEKFQFLFVSSCWKCNNDGTACFSDISTMLQRPHYCCCRRCCCWCLSDAFVSVSCFLVLLLSF